MSHLQSGYDRIRAIRWDRPLVEDDDHLVELMSDFVQTIRSCAESLGVTRGKIFDCLAKAIDSGLTIPNHMDAFVNDEPVRGNRLRGGQYVGPLLRSFLYWCALVDCGQADADDTPYESLIRFFEQGGKIYVEHGVLLEVNENRKRAFKLNF